MASGPINPWQIDGETMEIMTNFIFMEYKITTAMELKDTWSLKENLWPT